MFMESLCDFAIDLITVTAGAIIAIAILDQLNSALYVWLAFGLLVLNVPLRLWKHIIEKGERTEKAERIGLGEAPVGTIQSLRVLRTSIGDLFLILVGVFLFYLAYNTKIPLIGKSVRDYVQYGTTEIMTLIAAIAVALYTYKTVNQMIRNRRKETIEKMLEQVYSPIYESFFEAKKKGELKHRGLKWDISIEKLDDINRIIAKFGHYFDENDLQVLRDTLQKGKTQPEPFKSCLFEDADIAGTFSEIIEKKRNNLIKELRNLIKAP
jgi:hypothetical protein